MTEDIWNRIAPFGPFLGAHAAVSLYYCILTFLRTRISIRKWRKPRAIKYFPVALLGLMTGNLFVEKVIYSADFWLSRHAHSFIYETGQSLSICLGLVTYYMSLRATYNWIKRKNSQLFFEETEVPKLKIRYQLAILLLAIIATISFLIFIVSCFQGSFISGFMNGIKNVPLNQLTSSLTNVVAWLLTSLIIFSLCCFSIYRINVSHNQKAAVIR